MSSTMHSICQEQHSCRSPPPLAESLHVYFKEHFNSYSARNVPRRQNHLRQKAFDWRVREEVRTCASAPSSYAPYAHTSATHPLVATVGSFKIRSWWSLSYFRNNTRCYQMDVESNWPGTRNPKLERGTNEMPSDCPRQTSGHTCSTIPVS